MARYSPVYGQQKIFAVKKTLLALGAFSILVTSCQKDESMILSTPVGAEGNQMTLDKLDPAMSHTFNQHETWSGTITAEGYEGPLSGIPLTIYNADAVVSQGWTNATGEWSVKLNHTPSMDLKVVCEVPTLQSTTPILDKDFSIVVKPGQNQSAFEAPLEYVQNKSGQTSVSFRGRNNWYDDRNYSMQRARSWQNLPHMVDPDTLSDAFLTYIANSVPEEYPVGVHTPDFLAKGTTSLHITDSADVWMTFVAEGAGYKNTVGIFTYTENTVPQSASDIDTIWTVFENFSGNYSGGGLVAGDKVYIGSYPAGTYIGFALIANGYGGHGTNYRNNNVYYSIPEINPESNPEKLQHNVLLYDDNTGRFVIGFEDLVRSSGQSDEDFNDALFFCTSNPIEAIDTTGVTPIVEELADCDGDGLPDHADIAPCDARYAAKNTTQGRLMFEDLFPFKGDYDFNDIVIDYTAVAWNSNSGITGKMEYSFSLKADGGTLTNGFGFSIDDLSSSAISNVVFGNESGSMEEDGDATFILSSDCSFAGHVYMNNSTTTATTSSYPTYTVSFEINGASGNDVFWGEKLNPMIFQSLDNGKRNEIHLKFKKPSSEADPTLIGTGDDITLLEDVLFEGDWTNATPAERYWAQLLHSGESTTLPTTTNTYTDRDGYPWAMHVDINVKYPYEQIDINEAYPNFSNWVESNGDRNTNWFLSEVTGKVFE